jgi:thiamine biosynthesis lipoprotein
MTTAEVLSSPTRPYVTSRLRVALGTFLAVEAEACDRAIADGGVEAAFDAIARVERFMHPQRPESDLAAIAGAAPRSMVPVHAWTWDVLDLCRRLHEASGGVFDPCPDGRFSDLELVEPGWVRPRAPVCLDLGGVAKGYAVDRALEALRRAGCDSALVNAGGDLAVFGARSRTFLARTTRGTRSVKLANAALASSDADELQRPPQHRGYYHGVDRARVVSGQAIVVAPSAALADALTKCALLCDARQSESLLERFGATRI